MERECGLVMTPMMGPSFVAEPEPLLCELGVGGGDVLSLLRSLRVM